MAPLPAQVTNLEKMYDTISPQLGYISEYIFFFELFEIWETLPKHWSVGNHSVGHLTFVYIATASTHSLTSDLEMKRLKLGQKQKNTAFKKKSEKKHIWWGSSIRSKNL